MKRFRLQVSDRKRLICINWVKQRLLYLPQRGVTENLADRRRCGVDGNVRFTAQDPKSRDVIAVFMCDEDRGQVLQTAVNLMQSFRNSLTGNPGIDQNRGISRSDVNAVSAASACYAVEVQVRILMVWLPTDL
jgi:hypothetical protein